MVDTPRTDSYLLSSEFQAGQTNAISSQYIRDLVVSKANTAHVQTVTPVSSANFYGLSSTVNFAFGSNNITGSIQIGNYTEVHATGTTGTDSGASHLLGQAVQLNFDQSGSVVFSLGVAQEADYQVNQAGITVTSAFGHYVHLSANVGTITNFYGYSPQLNSGENTGTIGTWCDFFSPSQNGISGAVATRYSLYNADPGKQIITQGQVKNSTTQEIGPSIGAGYTSGRYYYGVCPNTPNPSSVGANTVLCSPFHVQRRVTFTKIGVRVTTAVAATNVQMAIYQITDGVLGNLILSTASQSSATTGVKEVAISWTPDPGNYVLCVNGDNGGVSITFVNDFAGPGFFGDTGDNTLSCTPYFLTTLGTWPNAPTLSYTTLSNAYPQVWLRL